MLQQEALDSESSQAQARQMAYDIWHKERDPALALFRKIFGADWTEDYSRRILFPGSQAAGPMSLESEGKRDEKGVARNVRSLPQGLRL